MDFWWLMHIWCSHTYLFDFQALRPYCPTVPLTSTPLILKVEKKYGTITYFVWRTYSVWRYLITLVLYNFPTCILKFLSLVSLVSWNSRPNLRVLGCFGICIGIHVLLEVVQSLLSFTDGFKVQQHRRGWTYPHPPKKKPKQNRGKNKDSKGSTLIFRLFCGNCWFLERIQELFRSTEQLNLPTPQCHAKRPPSG